jgi:hypothetical protein
MCLCQWVVILAVAVLVFLAGWLAIDEDKGGEWSITDHIITERSDAYYDAISDEGLKFEATDEDEAVNRTKSFGRDSLSIMYDAGKDGNVFSPANLRRICDLEQVVLQDEKYKDFCVLNENGECTEQVTTVTWFFYGTTLPDCDVELTQTVIDAKVEVIQDGILGTSERGQALKFFVSNDYVPAGYGSTGDTSFPDPSTWVNTRTRSLINFGAPIEVHRLPNKGNGDVEFEEWVYLRRNLHVPLQVSKREYILYACIYLCIYISMYLCTC